MNLLFCVSDIQRKDCIVVDFYRTNFPNKYYGLYQSKNKSENEHTIRKNRIHTRNPALFFIACDDKIKSELD